MSAPSNTPPRRATLPAWRALPAGIWAWGFGSLFMVSVLGASMLTVGIGSAFIAVALLAIYVREPERESGDPAVRAPLASPMSGA